MLFRDRSARSPVYCILPPDIWDYRRFPRGPKATAKRLSTQLGGGMTRVIVISNRVGLPDASGRSRAGGLEVAIRATLKTHPGVWFGWSGRVAAGYEVATRALVHHGMEFVVTDLTDEDYQEYYNGFANRVLWPILHYRLDLAEFDRRDLTGYMRVNEHFAAELAKFVKPDDLIWVHDYHLLPLAKALRERGLPNKLGLFLHTPMPPPELLTALPSHERLLPAMAHYDLIGFQTEVDRANFGRYLADECNLATIDLRSFNIGTRTLRLGVFPVGVETGEFEKLARRAQRSDFAQRALSSLPGPMIIGVDRLDYSKGLMLRIEAYERFLANNPDWRGKVTYLQITPKSRSEIDKYADFERRVGEVVGRVNGLYGEVSWTPIRYINRAHSRTALAGLYRAARVGLVTPLRDGMNLVAKEYIAAQEPEDPGVLVLSRFAGAAAEMKSAVLVNPYDTEATGVAIARALAMPLDERRDRYRAAMDVLYATDINDWGDRFIAALVTPTPKPSVLAWRESGIAAALGLGPAASGTRPHAADGERAARGRVS
jgi:trehalose 6-phosphate synthase